MGRVASAQMASVDWLTAFDNVMRLSANRPIPIGGPLLRAALSWMKINFIIDEKPLVKNCHDFGKQSVSRFNLLIEFSTIYGP